MKQFSFAVLGIAALLLSSCAEQAPKTPTVAEKAEVINAAFETPKPYAARVLDTLDIAQFLAGNPEFTGDSASIHDFYKSRGNQYAWFVNDTLSSAAGNMMNLLDPTDSTSADPWRKLVAEVRTGMDSVPLPDSLRLKVELGLTAQFFHLAEKEYGGHVQGDLRELDWYIPRRKKNYTMLLDSLSRRPHGPVADRTRASPIPFAEGAVEALLRAPGTSSDTIPFRWGRRRWPSGTAFLPCGPCGAAWLCWATWPPVTAVPCWTARSSKGSSTTRNVWAFPPPACPERQPWPR
jgi:hypothetical protein